LKKRVSHTATVVILGEISLPESYNEQLTSHFNSIFHFESYDMSQACLHSVMFLVMVANVDDPDHQPRSPPLLKIENSAKNQIKIFSSKTTWPFGTKLWWNGPYVVPFQNYIRRLRLPTKMAAVTFHFESYDMSQACLHSVMFLVMVANVVGHNSERGPHKDHSTKVWSRKMLLKCDVSCSL
jgi:hypothetical protein